MAILQFVLQIKIFYSANCCLVCRIGNRESGYNIRVHEIQLLLGQELMNYFHNSVQRIIVRKLLC